MSAFETIEQRRSINLTRLAFWDAECRRRRLEDWETDEVERICKQIRHDERRAAIRAQAAPPPRKRRGKR